MDANQITEFLGDCEVFEEETFDDFMERYQGFGAGLYTLIGVEMPHVFKHLKFYKAVAATGACVGGYWPDESYAIYSYGENAFVFNLDCEGTIAIRFFNINNSSVPFETGFWSETPLKDTIDFLKKCLSDLKSEI
ncbi:hypothetical protein ACLI08_07080 [Flavobacterium sp. RNTU_13]|uniref:hypothetical protein n=1 Tax=Flavobacterium sp. RNTU_13 TaxID=3375145 RepID=UPI0039859991